MHEKDCIKRKINFFQVSCKKREDVLALIPTFVNVEMGWYQFKLDIRNQKVNICYYFFIMMNNKFIL